jgi:hypothetical protein
MPTPEPDLRSAARKARDEQIAAEPSMPHPGLPSNAQASKMEDHLQRIGSHPVAMTGIVENGLVRPLDPAIKLPEHSRVIIVANKAG